MKSTRTFLALVLLIIINGMIFDHLTPVATGPDSHAKAIAYLEAQSLPTPNNPFTQDGCTFFPDILPYHDFRNACLMHDIAYWAGGDVSLKATADLEFKTAIAHTGPLGPNILAPLMYWSTRYIGNSWLTRLIGAHWGYGWK